MDVATLKMVVQSSGIAETERGLKRLRDGAGQAERGAASLVGVIGRLRGLLGAVASVGAAGAFLQMAQAARQMEGRLKLVAKSGEDAAAMLENIAGGAKRTYSSLESMTALYTRTRRAMSAYGKSSAEVLKFSEAVANAMRVGGAGAQESAAGIYQLSQALGSGKLAGDEFRTLMETAPVLMEQLAKSMGVPVGALKELAGQGKITAEVLFDAMTGSADELAAQAAKLPVTMGQALENVRTSATLLIGEIDKSVGALFGMNGVTEIVASAIAAFGAHLGEIAFVVLPAAASYFAGLGVSMLAATASAGGLSAAIAVVGNVLKAAFFSNPITAVIAAVAALVVYFGRMKEVMFVVREAASGLWGMMKAGWEGVRNVAVDVWEAITGAVKGAVGEQKEEIDGMTEAAGKGFWGWLETAANVFDGIAAALRALAAYMQQLFARMANAVSDIFSDMANGVKRYFAGIVNTLIDGINTISDSWAGQKLGMGKIDHVTWGAAGSARQQRENRANTVALYNRFAGKFGMRELVDPEAVSDKSFREIYDEQAKEQVEKGLAAWVRGVEERYGRQGEGGSAGGGGGGGSGGSLPTANIGGGNLGGGGRSGGGSGGGAQVMDAYRELMKSLGAEAAKLQAQLNEMGENNGMVSAYTKLRDLQADIVNDAEKYRNLSAAQRANLEAQAAAVDSLNQKLAIAAFAKDGKEKIEDLIFENSLIGKQAEEIERLRFVRELETQAKQIAVGMSAENVAALRAETDAIIAQYDAVRAAKEAKEAANDNDWWGGVKAGLQEVAGSADTLHDSFKNMTVNGISSFADALGAAAVNGASSFKEMAVSILQDIARMLLKMAVMKAVMSMLGMSNIGGHWIETPSLSGGLTSLQANGGAWANGVQFFAQGGIVNRPTLFGHAGGLGMMGEAGAEAIMPLARGKNGKLGVQMAGGGQNVTINHTVIVNNADGTTTTQSDAPAAYKSLLDAHFDKRLAESLRSGGTLDAAIKQRSA